jgi:hypothetical protein
MKDKRCSIPSQHLTFLWYVEWVCAIAVAFLFTIRVACPGASCLLLCPDMSVDIIEATATLSKVRQTSCQAQHSKYEHEFVPLTK